MAYHQLSMPISNPFKIQKKVSIQIFNLINSQSDFLALILLMKELALVLLFNQSCSVAAMIFDWTRAMVPFIRKRVKTWPYNTLLYDLAVDHAKFSSPAVHVITPLLDGVKRSL